MKLGLKDKRVLVTGGSRGLGRAICQVLAASEARVAFTYAADDQGASETLRLLAQAGSHALAEKVDACDADATHALAERLEKDWGGVEVLINNAGITQALPFALLDADDWDVMMRVNTRGPFVTTQALLRGMIRRSAGVVLNIGSLAGSRMLDAPIHYSASKTALVGLTRALARQVSRYSIRVNCLAPGLLEGGVGDAVPAYRVDDYVSHCALGRLGTFDEVARLAAFMVSERSSYMNGEVVVVDGGL